MKQTLSFLFVVASLVFIGCGKKNENGQFTINGKIKNVEDQLVYLEMIPFSENPPEVMDTAKITKGSFTLEGKSKEEGLFRIRMEKSKNMYLILNDGEEIVFSADGGDNSLKSISINSPANNLMLNFIRSLETRQLMVREKEKSAEAGEASGNDSLRTVGLATLETEKKAYKDFMIRFIDTCSDPVVSLFALGFANEFSVEELKKSTSGLSLSLIHI